MTDSGGIQEETTIQGVPCMTLREKTERPITITQGTNRLTPLITGDILSSYKKIMSNSDSFGLGTPKFWDGKAVVRIARIISESFNLGCALSYERPVQC